MINVVRRRGMNGLFEPGRPLQWAEIVIGYNLKEKNKLINEVSYNIIQMTSEK